MQKLLKTNCCCLILTQRQQNTWRDLNFGGTKTPVNLIESAASTFRQWSQELVDELDPKT